MPDLILPEILNLPPKMLPLVTDFNKYRYFLIEGGRGSAKSQSVGRLLLYIAEKKKVRIVCGREIQANIEESVYTLLKDLIDEHQLAFDVYKHKIVHRISGSEFRFKGFREQGSVSIKGLEGCDILWIDEAQSITKTTLDIIVPTIRKNNAKIMFTMNRFMRDDAVPEMLVGRGDCLHIICNFIDNPHCPLSLKIEAEEMRNKSERDFNHIWMGVPLATADDYLFNIEKLYESYDVKPFGESWHRQRVMGIDFAAQGNDQCVATTIDRMSNQHWNLTERVPWDEPDTMISVGKIVDLIGIQKPDIIMLDIGGMGKPVFDRLNEIGVKNLHPFDGGSTEGVDTKQYANVRSLSYHNLVEWFDKKALAIDKNKHAEVIKQASKIKRIYRSNGCRVIQAKVDMKKDLKYSPDDIDSLNMAVHGAIYFLGKASATTGDSANQTLVRRSTSKRRRK